MTRSQSTRHAEPDQRAAREREQGRDRDHADHRDDERAPPRRLAQQPERQRQGRGEDEGDVVRVGVREPRRRRRARRGRFTERRNASSHGRDATAPTRSAAAAVVADELADHEEERDEARVADVVVVGARRGRCARSVESIASPRRPSTSACGASNQSRRAVDERVQPEAREAERAGDLRHAQPRLGRSERALERRGRDQQQERDVDAGEADADDDEREQPSSSDGSLPPRMRQRSRPAPQRDGDRERRARTTLAACAAALSGFAWTPVARVRGRRSCRSCRDRRSSTRSGRSTRVLTRPR